MHYGQPVVITGVGLICSLGGSRSDVWKNLLRGAPNMGAVTLFDATRHRIDDCVVTELPPQLLASRVEEIKARGFLPPRKGRFRWMVLSAAIEAFDDAALDLSSPQDRAAGMVILGTMTGGSEEAERIAVMAESGKKPRVSDNIGKRPGIAIQDVARAFDLSGPNFVPTRMSTPFCRMVMEQVLENSEVEVDELGWINAHATSTVHGDVREAQAIAQIVGETGVRVSAPKSMTGHLLGGSGAAEAAFSAMSLRDQQIPPTVNLEDQDPECPVDCITSRTSPDFRYVLSNSWDFGGTGSCIVLERIEN